MRVVRNPLWRLPNMGFSRFSGGYGRLARRRWFSAIQDFCPVIPAKAGIQTAADGALTANAPLR